MGRERGRVTARGETWFPITLLGAEEIATEGLVDTGFTEMLSLPVSWRSRLRVPSIGLRDYELADGSVVASEIVSVRIRFLGRTRRVTAVLADADEVLIGTQLMRGHRLAIRFSRRTARLDPDR